MKVLARIAYNWAVRSFGKDHVHNLPTRALRTAEEAIELAQACDVPKEKMHELIDIVYARPKGDPQQEIGGIMVTTSVLANACFDHYLEHFFEVEMHRILDKPSEHFAKRNEEKNKLGLNI